jgi:tetratricopeptide (TPR) repeat protein
MGNALEDAGRQDEARASREEALESYERAIELDQSFTTGFEARLYKAGVLAELGRYNESIDAFDEIIETMPADYTLYGAAVLTDKGRVLEMMGDYEGAIIAFDRALELDPSNMIAMQEKGVALQSLGRISEAEAAFAKAKELGYEE